MIDGLEGCWADRLTITTLNLSLLSSSSLASLIRGQVLTTDGTPLVGVNVSFVNYPHYGYTLTRQDGMYVQQLRGTESLQLPHHTGCIIRLDWIRLD